MDDLTIRKIKDEKHGIYETPAMKQYIIPPFSSSSVLFIGRSGSGKTNLMAELLSTKKKFGYMGYFHKCWMFTGSKDQKFINHFKKNNRKTKLEIFTQSDSFHDELKKIIKEQLEDVENNGYKKAKRGLIIFEDIQNFKKFTKTQEFQDSFTNGRHWNCMIFFTVQYYYRCPKNCRCNVNNIFYFMGNKKELDLIVEEEIPPNMKRKDFLKLVKRACDEPHHFLSIYRKLPYKKRFRKNLNLLLEVNT